jgi:hypothetical protein
MGAFRRAGDGPGLAQRIGRGSVSFTIGPIESSCRMIARTTVAVLLANGLVFVSTASAQSLADAANAEKARRATIARPTTVFTNADLPPPSKGIPAIVPAAAAPTTRTIGDGKMTKAYWQARLAAHLPRLMAATRALELATDSLRRAVVLRQSVRTAAGVARADATVQHAVIDGAHRLADLRAAQAAIEGVHEEARRLGVLPGWLR